MYNNITTFVHGLYKLNKTYIIISVQLNKTYNEVSTMHSERASYQLF